MQRDLDIDRLSMRHVVEPVIDEIAERWLRDVRALSKPLVEDRHATIDIDADAPQTVAHSLSHCRICAAHACGPDGGSIGYIASIRARAAQTRRCDCVKARFIATDRSTGRSLRSDVVMILRAYRIAAAHVFIAAAPDRAARR
jgi:hypothetical protein